MGDSLFFEEMFDVYNMLFFFEIVFYSIEDSSFFLICVGGLEVFVFFYRESHYMDNLFRILMEVVLDVRSCCA